MDSYEECSFAAFRYALTGSDDLDRTPTYAIVTVPAATSVKWIHERMPAILPDKKSISAWLDPNALMDEVDVLYEWELIKCIDHLGAIDTTQL